MPDKIYIEAIDKFSDNDTQCHCLQDSDIESVVDLYALPENFDDIKPVFDRRVHDGARLEYEGNNAYNETKAQKKIHQATQGLQYHQNQQEQINPKSQKDACMLQFFEKPKYTPDINLVPGARTSLLPYGTLTKRKEKLVEKKLPIDDLENVPDLLVNYNKYSFLAPKTLKLSLNS